MGDSLDGVAALLVFDAAGLGQMAIPGGVKVVDVSTLPGAFSQVIPGLKNLTEPKLNVWGKEIEFEGGMLRQWLPYKWATPTKDPVETELERLQIYPSVPGKNVTIKKARQGDML